MPPTPIALRDSSNIKSASFNAQDGTADVTFSDGRSYRYHNITAKLVEEWAAAPSSGKWFASAIKGKPKDFPVEKLGESPAPGADPAPAEPPSPAPGVDAPAEITMTMPGAATALLAEEIAAREGAARTPAKAEAPITAPIVKAAAPPTRTMRRPFTPWREGSGTPPWHARRAPSRRPAK